MNGLWFWTECHFPVFESEVLAALEDALMRRVRTLNENDRMRDAWERGEAAILN